MLLMIILKVDTRYSNFLLLKP